ncbi:TIGR02678 family protein [Clostridium thermarum]|uniref:TIGR02678 family protein n=1 Tax=Clostridium thermarum TaxID=1716543 RepID=UPI0013D65C78|nr:TIGR02678 family protein [Clostridium thermarum]
MEYLKELLCNYIIFKDRDKELYYQIKDNYKAFKSFIVDKLGYELIIRGDFIKLEKLPGKSESFMGIEDFEDPQQYVFLLLLLIFLEDKGKDEQFLLSHITEFIASNSIGEKVEWTDYFTRKNLIRVLKFITKYNLIRINDGNEDSFASEPSKEVLFESTGISKYMVRNFNTEISEETTVKDIVGREEYDSDSDKGVLRRYRVYRRLLLSPIVYKETGYEEDFEYIKNYRNIIEEDFKKYLGWNLHVHRNGAMLVPPEKDKGFLAFPDSKGISDVILHINLELNKRIRGKRIVLNAEDIAVLKKEEFEDLITYVKKEKGNGWSKEYREMSLGKLCYEVIDFMEKLSMVKEEGELVKIQPLCGKIQGDYPKDYKGEYTDEQ